MLFNKSGSKPTQMYLGDTIVLISIIVIPIDIKTKNIAKGMRLQAMMSGFAPACRVQL